MKTSSIMCLSFTEMLEKVSSAHLVNKSFHVSATLKEGRLDVECLLLFGDKVHETS